MVICVCVFFNLNQDHRNHTFEKLSVAYGRRRKKIHGEAAGLRRRRKVWCYWSIPLSSKFYYFLVLYTYWKKLWHWQMSVFSIISYITSVFVLGWFFATWQQQKIQHNSYKGFCEKQRPPKSPDFWNCHNLDSRFQQVAKIYSMILNKFCFPLLPVAKFG